MLPELEADRTCIAEPEAQNSLREPSIFAMQIEPTPVHEQLDSLVLTLPNEITSEIFVHFLPIYPICPPLSGLLSPTILTHVCRQWREIALAIPALWRAISLSNEYIIPSNQPAYISDILARSGCCPLSIWMDEFEHDKDRRGSEVLAAALPHCARWEYLKLYLARTDLPTIESGLPLLRHLDLQLNKDPNGLVVAFYETPLLRTVILDNIVAPNIVLPWTQLTSVTLRYICLGPCVPILQQTSNLVHCKLVLFYIDGPDADITLPCLDSLIIDTDEHWGMGHLNTFTTPSLRSLEISERFLGPNPILSLISFISKSGCKLQDVTITRQRLVTRKMYRDTFPSIPTFSFTGWCDGETVDEEDR
ncbi:hypothetical protein B0H13DRAFT_1859190 [Mycena leptocephala]|nr:hypothetical protein B0H13DRAFT_1859190 [Mycena leptocephala]